MGILKGLRNEALSFEEQNHEGKETLAIAIINIGHCVDPMYQIHANLLKKFGFERPPEGQYEYEDFFELTCNGEVLNLNEYACLIADTRRAPKS